MIVQKPTYISGAPILEAKKVGAPVFGWIGAALLGAVAAYYVPKMLDRYGPSLPDPDHGEPVELEIEPGR